MGRQVWENCVADRSWRGMLVFLFHVGNLFSVPPRGIWLADGWLRELL